MMREWRTLILLSALAGCDGSCACEGETTAAEAAGRTAPPAATPANASAAGEAASAPPTGGASGAGAGATGAVATAWDGPAAQRWLDAAKADGKKLDAEAKRLVALKVVATKTTPAALASSLPARVGGFAASAPAGSGTVNAGSASLPVASRTYQAPKSAAEPGDVYLKLTDTGAAPELRAPVIAALRETSVVDGYYTRGGFVRGFPAVLTYSTKHRAGKAAVLIGDRYLLEARIVPVASPDKIATLLGQLDWSALEK
jgi:hypothetical protein